MFFDFVNILRPHTRSLASGEYQYYLDSYPR